MSDPSLDPMGVEASYTNYAVNNIGNNPKGTSVLGNTTHSLSPDEQILANRVRDTNEYERGLKQDVFSNKEEVSKDSNIFISQQLLTKGDIFGFKDTFSKTDQENQMNQALRKMFPDNESNSGFKWGNIS